MELTGEAAVRAAEAVLRANGGRWVQLRMPAPAVAGSVAEELGLATPGFQEVALGPVVFRKAESTAKLLVAASAVKALVGTLAFESAEVLFEASAGVAVDGMVYGVEGCVGSAVGGVAYCYCLTLRAPVG